MEITTLEDDAKARAAKHVANMLHAPDKLEKIKQMKFNVERKKASVEAMLKTAMQSQLDGVKTGLTQLEKAMKDIQDVHQCMDEMDESLKEIPTILEQLHDVSKLNIKHSQLATARENMKHIFMVPETVRQAEQLIQDGKLLDAHKSLVELENSRDDLLFELHKLPHQSPADRELLSEYFGPVQHLSDKMEKQIKFVLRRTLNTVQREPKVVVTALRIIEREERSDADCLQRQKSTGFLPQDRPKRWKDKGLGVLKINVQERIEGNQLDSREDNKMWLVRHLELIRMITGKDLRIAKSLCQPVFPPHYNILEHFLQLYHEALSNRLVEIIGSGLEGQEYVTVLSWVIQTYPGKELMADLSLGIPQSKVKPLLGAETVIRLQAEYLDNMRKNYSGWMRNTINAEMEDWKKSDDPELDTETCFHTQAPIIVYQMIDENLQVAQTISGELVNKVLLLSMEEVTRYGKMYKGSIIDYKDRYFKDRGTISRFTRYMIAIVNNCERFRELAEELKERWWKPGYRDNDADIAYNTLISTYKDLLTESSGYLLDELFLDINAHFSDILTSKWQNSTDAIDTVCETLQDYFEDYQYLKPKNFETVVTIAQDRVACSYIEAMLKQNNVLRPRLKFETAEDRRKAAEKIRAEAEQVKRFYHRVAGDVADFDSPFDAISQLSELLKQDDSDWLALDIGTLVKKYPDVSQEQVLCLLLLRGDLNKAEAREKATEYVSNTGGGDGVRVKSILSQVQVSSSGVGEVAVAAGNVVAAANRFAGKDFTNLNPFANKDQSTNPFDED